MYQQYCSTPGVEVRGRDEGIVKGQGTDGGFVCNRDIGKQDTLSGRQWGGNKEELMVAGKTTQGILWNK